MAGISVDLKKCFDYVPRHLAINVLREFGADERAILEAAALRVLERPGPEVGREPGGRPVISWGAHLHSPVLRVLSHHPRICAPAKQLLGGRDIYVHQSRINNKGTKTNNYNLQTSSRLVSFTSALKSVKYSWN